MPTHHVPAPVSRAGAKVAITLMRTRCLGSCPSYQVTMDSQGVVVFEGDSSVVATGKYTATVDAAKVRELAEKFVADDFYSMDSKYELSATDAPTYVLSISIDGDTKKVVDYLGAEMGMPEVIRDLEQEVDALAGTRRWVDGADGLVEALRAEDFDFRTRKAQVILKRAARRGQTATVRQLLAAGVPLHWLASSPGKPAPAYVSWMDDLGWLASASGHFQTLQVLMAWGASRHDQSDKDVALAFAAQDGDLEAVKALIGYGANPNADLSTQMIPQAGGVGEFKGPGDGSILIYAARSGNPRVVREILRYHPNLEARGPSGQTAMFAAADYGLTGHYQNRVACVRLLAEAGANVNARDKNGDTPLHETFLTDVERELLKLGANVNARDKDGDTPLFTTVDDDAIPLFIRYGADLSIRNNKGLTVLEATKSNGPIWEAELRKAIAKAKHSKGGNR
jgi:ankyrin repeat protein